MQRERWLVILIAFIWVGSWAFVLAHDWAGESVSSDHYLLWGDYHSWGKEHPECRNRFGFWPDGTRMSDDDAGLAAALIRSVQRDNAAATPEQIARDKWADDVQAKIASCERDQWMPLVMASEIRKLRIQLIAFSLQPPILILAGLGMMTRARRIITKTAGKLVTAFGVLIGAVIISAFATRISDQFDTIVFMYLHEPPRDSIWYPVTLHDLRLDAIFAILIPAGIVLWWRRPDTASKPVLACCLGIAAGFVPVMIQIISWPFIYRSDGVRATAVVATIGAASLSVMATTRILKGDTQAKQDTFVHIQRGLRRLYVTLLIPWVAWFGYAAYESNGSIRFLQSELDQFTHYYLSWLQDFKNDESDARRNMAAKQLEKMRIVWDVRTNDEFDKSISSSIEESRDRLTNDVYALLAGVMPFLLYPIAL